MIDMHRHFTQQQRKRIDQDRHWLSQNRDEVMKLLRARDGDICLWCNKPNEDYEIIAATDQCQKLRPAELAIDHIVPASSGGETDIDNLYLLHKPKSTERIWPAGGSQGREEPDRDDACWTRSNPAGHWVW